MYLKFGTVTQNYKVYSIIRPMCSRLHPPTIRCHVTGVQKELNRIPDYRFAHYREVGDSVLIRETTENRSLLIC